MIIQVAVTLNDFLKIKKTIYNNKLHNFPANFALFM